MPLPINISFLNVQKMLYFVYIDEFIQMFETLSCRNFMSILLYTFWFGIRNRKWDFITLWHVERGKTLFIHTIIAVSGRARKETSTPSVINAFALVVACTVIARVKGTRLNARRTN